MNDETVRAAANDPDRPIRPTISRTYRTVMAVARPIVRWWGRLEVVGADLVPVSGPTLLFVNHDSAWDPVVIGVALGRRRQVHALAKSSLWRHRPVAWVLNGMGQIPIDRGRGDREALAAAIEHLRAGACIGVFPEGTVSRGRVLRARSGAGRLTLAEPGATVVCAALTGVVDVVRFPKRPTIRLQFFRPTIGKETGESAAALTVRLMAEIRALAPPALPGRAKTRAEFERQATETNQAGTPAG